MKKKTIGFVLALVLSFSGCRKTPKPTPEPKPQEKLEIQSFVSPTRVTAEPHEELLTWTALKTDSGKPCVTTILV